MTELDSFLSHFSDYAAYIQLFAAVNFAYIIPNFSEKLYQNVFDVERMCKSKHADVDQELTLLGESVKRMEPCNIDGESTEGTIEMLSMKIEEVRGEWNNYYKEKLPQAIETAKQNTNYRGLFLVVGLFCAWLLMAFAMSGHWPLIRTIWATSILMSIPTILLNMFRIWKETAEYSCAILSFAFALILSGILGAILADDIESLLIEESSYWRALLIVVVVVLPLLSILFTFVRVFFERRKIKLELEEKESEAEQGINDVLEKKKQLERAKSVIKDIACQWGSQNQQ